MASPFKTLKSLLNPGRWIYEDAEYFAVDVDLEPGAASRWLPARMRLAPSLTATVFVARFPRTTFGAVYNEAGVFLHVRRMLLRAVHCPWMLVDHDVPLVLGRDLLGYPKKMGEIAITRDGDRVEARVERRGELLFELELSLREHWPTPAPMLGRRHYNVRGGLGLPLPRVVTFRPREQIVAARRADAKLRVRGSKADPLDELGLGAVRGATAYRVNLGAGLPPRAVDVAGPLYVARTWTARNA